MPDQPQVVFAHTLKALLSQVFERRGLLTPAVRAELAALGVDPEKPRDLPIDRWWQVVALAARHLAPGEPDSKAFFELGCEGTRGFAASVIGKAMLVLLRATGLRSAMLRLADHYRTVDTVAQITTAALSPKAVEVTFRYDHGLPYPTYTQGVLHTALELLGAENPRVLYEVRDDQTVVYTASWA